ncbi:hypothetical protein TNCV_5082001 [Trichonephila clavipes]|nr:hypothetical protein TNCV_5082001 [Trichonephila clavipes]
MECSDPKPLLTYPSSVRGHAVRTNINLLKSSQNVILRQILDAYWYMRNADFGVAGKIPTILQMIRKLVSNFFNNIDGDEAHFWLNGYANKQNCRISREANPQVYVETPLHPEKLTVWCALWAGGILLQKR